jgi:hypothetical protein
MTKFNEIKKQILIEVIIPAARNMIFEIGKDILKVIIFPNKKSYEYSYEGKSRIGYTPSDDEEIPELTEVIAESLRRMKH